MGKSTCRAAAMGLAVVLIAFISGCAGVAGQSESRIRYSAGARVESLQTVTRPGDFGLFYAGEEKAQVPVRVNAGDTVGFTRDEGHLLGVAGPFKIDIPASVREAYWKRLRYTDDGSVAHNLF